MFLLDHLYKYFCFFDFVFVTKKKITQQFVNERLKVKKNLFYLPIMSFFTSEQFYE